jgi:hypothetical protein
MRCLPFFPVGEQVEQALQLGGAGPEVRCELGPGQGPAAVQRLQQPAVVVGGPAELTAGALGQGQGEALLLLELAVEAAQRQTRQWLAGLQAVS